MSEPNRSDRVLVIPVRSHGPFGLSRKYNEAAVLAGLVEARMWNTSIRTLPILPDWAAKLDEDLVVRSIFGTAAIEGSPLSEPEVSALLTATPSPARASEKAQVILNLRAAYELAGIAAKRHAAIRALASRLAGTAEKSPTEAAVVSEDRIRELHETIARGLDHDRYLPGTYRLGPVEVGDRDHGGTYRPPKVPDDIAMLMARFVEWMNGDALAKGTPPLLRAFLAHYHLALIHPFKDGNGRLARVVEAELLAAAGFRYAPLMMSNYYYENIDEYYRAFSAAEQSDFDITPFLKFCLDGLVRSLTSVHTRVTELIRRLALRKHFDDLKRARKLSTRRHALLLMLLDDDRSLNSDDLKTQSRFAPLYQGVSNLAVWRDLRRLQDMGLLVPAETGRLKLNLEAIG